METTAYDFNLNKTARYLAGELNWMPSKALRKIKEGIYFQIGDMEAVAERVIEIEKAKS